MVHSFHHLPDCCNFNTAAGENDKVVGGKGGKKISIGLP